MSDLYNHVVDVVNDTARSVHKRFPTLYLEDIKNVGWEYVYANKESVEEYLGQTENGLRFIGYRIRRAMLEYCGREMRAATGIDYRDTYTYTAKVVKELLPDVFDHENWQPGPTSHDDMPRAKKLVNETGDRMAMLADISRVVKYVTNDQYNLLVWRYKYSLSYPELGKELDITDNAARLRVDRVIDRLVYALAKVDPGDDDPQDQEVTGGRRILSNAAARARTADNY